MRWAGRIVGFCFLYMLFVKLVGGLPQFPRWCEPVLLLGYIFFSLYYLPQSLSLGIAVSLRILSKRYEALLMKLHYEIMGARFRSRYTEMSYAQLFEHFGLMDRLKAEREKVLTVCAGLEGCIRRLAEGKLVSAFFFYQEFVKPNLK